MANSKNTSKGTSAKVAHDASKLLKSERSTAIVKEVSGSALSQKKKSLNKKKK